MRRFLLSYRHKTNIEGCLFSDGTIYLNDSWIPRDEWDNIDHLVRVISEQGKYPVTLVWIDEQPSQGTV